MKKFNNLTSSNSREIVVRSKQTSVLCTISGGQDSVLTLFGLLHAQSKESLQFFYCQHFWQVKNFFAAKFLFQLSYLLNVCYTFILPQTSLLTENDSRQWRKKNYWRVSQIEQILLCVTGHTETDTLEKNLNNIFRGTSPTSLSYSNFLNFENRTGTFFSNLNINTSGVYKFLRDKKDFNKLKFANIANNKLPVKKNQPKRFLKNIVTEQNVVTATKISSKTFILLGSKHNDRLSFQFYKQKKPFLNKFQFSLINSSNNEKFTEISIPLRNLYFTKKTSNILKINTEFYNNRKNLFHSIKSYSFCFSSNFFNLRISLNKPLKKITRSTVSKLMRLYKFPNIMDVTNFSFCFSRNKIRHQMLPFLRCLIQPKIESVLTQFFELLNQENQERENELSEVFFLCKFVILEFGKKKSIYLKSTPTTKLFLIPFRLQPSFLPLETMKPHQSSREFEKLLLSDFSQNLVKINKCFLKNIIKKSSKTTTGSLSQKLFFEYKNLNLNYSQIRKIQSFY